MEFVIWVETRLAGKALELCPVASVERSASGIEPEELGLTLQDGKTVLKQIQAKMVHSQISIWTQRSNSVEVAVENSASRTFAVDSCARSSGLLKFVAVAIPSVRVAVESLRHFGPWVS